MFKKSDRLVPPIQNYEGSHVDNHEFVIVDIETTGLSYSYNKITEIAAVKLKNNKIIDRFETLVNPQVRIPSFITKLTGIDNKLVEDKPKIYHVLPKFIRFLGERCFIGHNATFDFNFLNYNSQRHHNFQLNNEKICTCRLARRLLPELPSKSLTSVSNHLGIEEPEHRALSDALATAKIFTNFLNKLKQNNINFVDELVRFQSSKISRISYLKK